ncbi:MAG: hypothetical protein SGPRY_010751 [Prymnesium sp.]
MLSGKGRAGVPFVWSCPLGGEALCPSEGRVWRIKPSTSPAARTWLGGSVPAHVHLNSSSLSPLGPLRVLGGVRMGEVWDAAFALSDQMRAKFPHVGLEDGRPFLWQACEWILECSTSTSYCVPT